MDGTKPIKKALTGLLEKTLPALETNAERASMAAAQAEWDEAVRKAQARGVLPSEILGEKESTKMMQQAEEAQAQKVREKYGDPNANVTFSPETSIFEEGARDIDVGALQREKRLDSAVEAAKATGTAGAVMGGAQGASALMQQGEASRIPSWDDTQPVSGLNEPDLQKEMAVGAAKDLAKALGKGKDIAVKVGKKVLESDPKVRLAKQLPEFIFGENIPSAAEQEEMRKKGIEPGLKDVGLLDPVDLLGTALAGKLAKPIIKAAPEAISLAKQLMKDQAGELRLAGEITPKFMREGNYSMLTADNPLGSKLSKEENLARAAKLKEELDRRGIDYYEGLGKYGQLEGENTVLIPHTDKVTPEVTAGLASKYGQESVAHRLPGDVNELQYVKGPKAGQRVRGKGVMEVPSEATTNYTEIGGKKYNLGLDFENVDPGKLIHISRSETPLTHIDPKFMGTGAAGRESQRLGRIPRSYYYESHALPEDVVVSGAKTIHEVARPTNIIDLSSEEAQKYIKAAEAINPGDPDSALEKILHENGFAGYKNSNSALPDAVALFEAQPVVKGEALGPQHFEQFRGRRAIELNPPQAVEAAAPKPTKSIEELKELVLKDPRYLQALELEKEGFGGVVNERYRHLLYEYEQKYNPPIAEGSITRLPTYDVPQVAEALRGVPKDQRLMVLSNDAKAYNALMAKYPQLEGREDWAELALADYVKHKAPPSKFAKVTSVNPTAKLGPKAQSTLEKVKENELVYGEPEDYEKSFIAKNEAGEPIGHLGLDENQHTRSIKVDPDYRGQGVAPELYKKALNKYGVIRSDYRHNQLEGGQGLWESFERKYPGAVRQARDPETLKPLDYRVWQKDTNLEARKAEEAIEKQIDGLREGLSGNPIEGLVKSTKEYQEALKKLRDSWDKPTLVHDRFRRELSNVYNTLYREIYAKAPKQKDIEKQIDALIKQHKALTKKSKHVMYATGGVVLSDSPDGHEQKQLMFYDGGEVPTWEGTQPIQAEQPMAMGETPTWEGTESVQEKYGQGPEQVLAAGSALGKGLFGPAFTAAQVAAGASPEYLRGIEEANPITSGLFGVAGFLAPLGAGKAASIASKLGMTGLAEVLPTAAKFTQLGALEAIGSKIAPFAGESLAARMGNVAAKGLVENAIFAGGDEVSKMILRDPNQSAETAISNIMLAGALGSILGVGVEGAVGAAEKAAGSKIGKFIADFRGRLSEHVENPDPVSAMHKELSEYYDGIKGIANEVYGASGLKEKDIAKALPEMHSGVGELTANISNKLEEGIAKLGDDPHARMLRNAVEEWKENIGGMGSVGPMGERITPLVEPKVQDVWQATEKLKQQLQEWGQYNKELVAVAERPFRNLSKSLSYDLRTALEDNKIWGKAGERQKAINEAFSEYLPKLKDFESKFTTKLAGERVIDPGKVSTYLNQIGKPNAEIKQTMLKDFLDASESYKSVIEKTHANLGLESPVVESALNVTKNSLKERTKGAAVADALVNRALTESGSNALAAGVGAKAGSLLGIGHELGAILGVGSLSPLFKTILPTLAKAVAEKEISVESAKAAVSYADAVAKGRMLIVNGLKNVFRPESHVLPQYAMPSHADRKKLEKRLEDLKRNPEAVLEKDKPMAHYMPMQSAAMTQTAISAANYLDSLRPDTDPKAPLDPKPVASAVQKSDYQNALDIANQPAFILVKVKEGTINAKDIQHLNALYPALAASLRQELMTQLIDHKSKNKPIPYKTKIGISMFLGQPLDSTMTPNAFQSTQAPMSPKTGADQTQTQMGQPSKGRPSAPALQKMPGLFQTHEQAKTLHRNKP